MSSSQPRRLSWRWAFIVLLAAACAAGTWLTSANNAVPLGGAAGLNAATLASIRQYERVFRTAQAAAATAHSAAEQELASQALGKADALVDAEFAIAEVEVAELPAPPQTAAGDAAHARIAKARAAVAQDQQQLAALQAKPKSADDSALSVAKAQLLLDQARLTDAVADAARSGPNAAAALQELQREHEALHHTAAPAATPPSAAHGLIGELDRALQRNSELHQLQSAEHDVEGMVPAILAEHNRLDTQFGADERAPNAAPTGTARAAHLRALTAEQQQVSRFDAQADAAAVLADIYRQWEPQVAASRQRALHSMLQRGLWLLAIIAVLLTALGLIARALHHPRLDRKRATTLEHLLRLVVEAVAIIAVLIVLLGQPPELLTVIGLCGAGLTVAFQDALLSLAGWFVLMGRNGVRLGDWVEISGVVGEVVEVRLLKTVLLETGNWIAPGHPTGRRVFFPNSYALKGSYFNYCTAGQWMWDQLEVPLIAGLDAHVALTKVNDLLQHEFGPGAAQARTEWADIAQHSPEPTALLRPQGDSFTLVIRYPVPARQRTAARERLWRLVAEALRQGGTAALASEISV